MSHVGAVVHIDPGCSCFASLSRDQAAGLLAGFPSQYLPHSVRSFLYAGHPRPDLDPCGLRAQARFSLELVAWELEAWLRREGDGPIFSCEVFLDV